MFQQATAFGVGKSARMTGLAPFIATPAHPERAGSATTQSRKRRAAAAWIFAAGLGLSAALCPLPRDLRLLDLFPPGDQSTEASGQIAFGLPGFEALRIDLQAMEAADLAEVTGLLSRYPYLPVDMLLAVVQIHGVSDVQTVLESLLPAINGYTGGGFALAASPGGGTALPVAVVALLEYLRHVPALAVGALLDVVATVLPAVLGSLGIPAPGTTAPRVELDLASDTPNAATPAEQDPVSTEASGSAAPDAGLSAATGDPAPGPAADPAPQPQASTITAVTDSASTVTNEGLLSSESTLLGGGIASASGLDGISVTSGGSTESATGTAGSSEGALSSADSESTVSSGSAGGGSIGEPTGGDGSGGGGSTGGDGSGGGGSAGDAG